MFASQNGTCTSEDHISSFSISIHIRFLIQVVPLLAVLVPVPPIFALPAQAVKSRLRAGASLLVLQIHFFHPAPVSNVILTAQPVPDRLSTNATLAQLLVLSLPAVDVYLRAPNPNILTLRLQHAKLVILVALHVPAQVHRVVSHVPAQLRFSVAVHVFLRIVRATSYLGLVCVYLHLCKFHPRHRDQDQDLQVHCLLLQAWPIQRRQHPQIPR